jgi:hypothetical protein
VTLPSAPGRYANHSTARATCPMTSGSSGSGTGEGWGSGIGSGTGGGGLVTPRSVFIANLIRCGRPDAQTQAPPPDAKAAPACSAGVAAVGSSAIPAAWLTKRDLERERPSNSHGVGRLLTSLSSIRWTAEDKNGHLQATQAVRIGREDSQGTGHRRLTLTTTLTATSAPSGEPKDGSIRRSSRSAQRDSDKEPSRPSRL